MKLLNFKPFLSTAFLLGVAAVFFSGTGPFHLATSDKPFSPITAEIADSVLQTMSLKEKIAQLFVLDEFDSSETYVSGYILQTTVKTQIPDLGALPYFVGIDLKSTHPLAQQIACEDQLTATNSTAFITEYAEAFAKKLSKSGINMVLGISLSSDDLESSSNQTQSIIGNPSEVLTYSEPFMQGLRSAGMLAIVSQLSNSENDNTFENSAPLRMLINAGAQGIEMKNELQSANESARPNFERTTDIESSKLRNQLGFNGLIWSDLSHANDPINPTDVLKSGSDVVIVHSASEHLITVEQAVISGKLSEAEIDAKCRKVIQAKLWIRKNSDTLPDSGITSRNFELNQRKLVEKSLTLLKNESNLIPLQRMDTLQIAVVQISKTADDTMNELLWRYAPGQSFHIGFSTMETDLIEFEKIADQFNCIILLAEPMDAKEGGKYGINEEYQLVLDRLAYRTKVTLVWSGNPKALLPIHEHPRVKAVVAAYKNTEWTSDYALQAIFGGRAMSGKLNGKLQDDFGINAGISTEKIRLGYGIPEEVGIRNKDLQVIDQIAASGIENKAYPGCQVWFAKDGIVIVNRNYGFHTYEPNEPVIGSDLYDLASITKIAASTAALMKLSDMGKFNLDHNLCDYMEECVDTTNFMNMDLRSILSHQAGLPPFVPFYSKTLTKGVPRYDVYSIAPSEMYPLRVARDLYIRKDYPEMMLKQVLNQNIAVDKKYKYSDIGYYFTLNIIEKQSGMKLNDFLDSTFYKPMGMATMTYKPLDKFDKSRIAPTEFDRLFRKQLVHGDVHDPGAAMLGGVGGHAGLFSNANDLGKLMQMMLDGGVYGGERYLRDSTIRDFVKCQFCDNDNRRGAGFDKPLRQGGEGPSCGCIDLESFGHQGFTGTVTWADPRDKVVYVFLSNRVYPDAENKKLAEMGIRTTIQKEFYNAISKRSEIANQGK